MTTITEKAANYAAKKANEVLTNVLAQAYADGYREGYKDCEEKLSVDLRDGKTEYVDLGLPSGTLWAKDYEMENGELIYLPYEKARTLRIPTKDNWEELQRICQFEFELDSYYCLTRVLFVGPNGNHICFRITGKKMGEKKSGHTETFFWIKDDKQGYVKNAIHLLNSGVYKNPRVKAPISRVEDMFCGYKLPVRLVLQKQ